MRERMPWRLPPWWAVPLRWMVVPSRRWAARWRWVVPSLWLAAPSCWIAAPPAAAVGWSAPRSLGTCPSAAAPQIAFPSSSPSTPTGPGAILWLEGLSCGAGRPALAVAPLDHDDRPGVPERVALDGASALLANGATLGRVAVTALARRRALVLQGNAAHGLEAAAGLRAPAGVFAATRAYLGDVAVASVQPGPSIAVYVERWFSPRFSRFVRIPIGAGRVTALTVTMDYRSDVLVAWQQRGAIYAHVLRSHGRREPTQRVGPSAPGPQLQALVSDDDHGMIAWSSSRARAQTSVYLSLSTRGVRFPKRRLLASFADPAGVARQPGSLALVRLASENVMLAWSEVRHGHGVVLAAPAVFAGVRKATRLTPPDGQSALAALAPGAANEAIALWREAEPSWGRARLWAARTYIEHRGRVGFSLPELLAPAGTARDPVLAVDPGDDRALAVWLRPGGTVVYALGPSPTGYRRRKFTLPAVPGHAGAHRLRILGAVVLAVALSLGTGALLLRRRAR